MAKKIFCPVCGDSDKVEKVSTLYLTGIGLKAGSAKSRKEAGRFSIHRNFAPPASGKQVTIRPVHPDQVVLVFSLVVPFFLYGILTTQPQGAVLAIAALGLFYGFYFWQRSKLAARFQEQVAAQKAAADRIQRGIDRWMKLYYCACDDWVFEPGTDTLAPLDQMMGVLLQDP